jgi:hypothetical protein
LTTADSRPFVRNRRSATSAPCVRRSPAPRAHRADYIYVYGRGIRPVALAFVALHVPACTTKLIKMGAAGCCEHGGTPNETSSRGSSSSSGTNTGSYVSRSRSCVRSGQSWQALQGYRQQYSAAAGSAVCQWCEAHAVCQWCEAHTVCRWATCNVT